MNNGDGEERVEAGGETFPARDQAAVLAVAPGTRPLGLEARDALFDWPPTRLSDLPPPFGDLRAAPALSEALAEVFGILPCIRRQDLAPLARSASLARGEAKGFQPREALGPLVAIGRRGARGQRHTRTLCAAVAEEALALPAIRHALTAACARGQKRQPRRRRATESSHALRPARAGGLA
jgi:hypothetical protein